MMTTVFFLAALITSLTGFGYLAYINPKRRRLKNASKHMPVPSISKLGWLIVAGPGLPLLLLGELSAFVSWLGALSVAGWMLVLVLFPQAEESAN